jgi:hypothetical protein
MIPSGRYVGRYNPDYLPGTKGRWFWSSTVFSPKDDLAFIFSGSDGDVGGYLIMAFIPFTRCVQGGPQPSAASAIVAVPHYDSRVSSAFASLGNMYEAAGLIWSAVTPKKMNHDEAIQYGQSLGGGARLPTQAEW